MSVLLDKPSGDWQVTYRYHTQDMKSACNTVQHSAVLYNTIQHTKLLQNTPPHCRIQKDYTKMHYKSQYCTRLNKIYINAFCKAIRHLCTKMLNTKQLFARCRHGVSHKTHIFSYTAKLGMISSQVSSAHRTTQVR